MKSIATKRNARRALVALAVISALLLLGYLETQVGLPNH